MNVGLLTKINSINEVWGGTELIRTQTKKHSTNESWSGRCRLCFLSKCSDVEFWTGSQALHFWERHLLHRSWNSPKSLHRQQRWVCTLGDTLGRRCSLVGFQPTLACKERIITKSKGKWWHSPVSRWVQPPRRPRDLFTTKLSLHLRGREKGQRNCKRWKYISF